MDELVRALGARLPPGSRLKARVTDVARGRPLARDDAGRRRA
jgi:hypothetical protein